MNDLVKIKELNGLERSLTITVPNSNYKEAFSKQLVKLQSSVKLDGFRKGKIPEKVILSKYNEHLHQESIQDLIETNLEKVLLENNIETASPPKLNIDTNPVNDKDMVFTATFEIFPDFEIDNLESISVDEPNVEIQSDDVEKVIKNIQKQHITWNKKKNEANIGDKIVIDYEGTVLGKKFEGSSQKDFTFIIGDEIRGDAATQGLFNEFYKVSTKAKKDDKKNFSYKLPDNFADKNISGKVVEYKIVIKNIYEGILPKLNTEFYKKFGLENCDDSKFKENIKKHMELELKEKVNSIKTADLNAKLIEQYNFEIPKHMLESQKQSLINSYKGMMKDADDSIQNELNNIAMKRAKLNMIYMKIAKVFKISVSDQDVQTYISKTNAAQQETIKKEIKGNTDYLNQLKNRMLEDVIIKDILKKIKTNKVKKSFSEVMN